MWPVKSLFFAWLRGSPQLKQMSTVSMWHFGWWKKRRERRRKQQASEILGSYFIVRLTSFIFRGISVLTSLSLFLPFHHHLRLIKHIKHVAIYSRASAAWMLNCALCLPHTQSVGQAVYATSSLVSPIWVQKQYDAFLGKKNKKQ